MDIRTRTITSNCRKFIVNNYIVEVDEYMRSICWNFSNKIIGTNNQYNMMLPNFITDEE